MTRKEEEEIRDERIVKMREEGATYEKVAHRFGMSKQRAYQIYRKVSKTRKRAFGKNRPKSVYVNLEDWAIKHQCSWLELASRANIKPEVFYRAFVHGEGRNTHQAIIDRLLSVTGLTYEKLFKREKKR